MSASVLDSHLKFKKYRPVSESGLEDSNRSLASSLMPKSSVQHFFDLESPRMGFLRQDVHEHSNSLTSTTLTNDSEGSNDYKDLLDDTNELIESRKNLMSELKIDHDMYSSAIDAICQSKEEPDHDYLTPSNEHYILEHVADATETFHPRVPVYSITRKRAEKIKNIIENYYSCLERYQNTVHFEDIDHKTPKFPNVEGVFNPLQIMRNRRIRKKYNEKLTTFPFGDIKPPSRVFSKYKSQRLIWQVNLNEYNNDIYWRENHWNELKNPKGGVWFPKAESQSTYFGKFEKPRRLRRLQEQMFAGFDGEFNKEEDEAIGDEKRLNSLPRINESSASLARQEHYRLNSFKKIHGHSNSLGNLNKSSTNIMGLASAKSDEDLDLAPTNNSSGSGNYPSHSNGNRSRKGHSTEDSSRHSSFERPVSKSFDSLSIIPYTPTNNQSVQNISGSGHATASSPGEYYSDDDASSDGLLEQIKSIKSLKNKLVFSELRLRASDQNLTYILSTQRDNFYKKLSEFDHLQTQNETVSKTLQAKISEVEATLEKFNQFNNVKSVKIEELLGYCDRTNGEINTSVTLKIRNLSEKRDQLCNINDEWVFNWIYNCLESLIVLVLWVVWIFVEIWRLVRGILVMAIKLLKFIFL